LQTKNEIAQGQGRIGGLVTSLDGPFSVIPAKAGIQSSHRITTPLDSGFHRSDGSV